MNFKYMKIEEKHLCQKTNFYISFSRHNRQSYDCLIKLIKIPFREYNYYAKGKCQIHNSTKKQAIKLTYKNSENQAG